MQPSSTTGASEEQRGARRRRKHVPVTNDRRVDERRNVPGFPVLIEELALELELDPHKT